MAPETDEGCHITGVTADDYVDSAENVANFWRYLGPDDPDPEIRRPPGFWV